MCFVVKELIICVLRRRWVNYTQFKICVKRKLQKRFVARINALGLGCEVYIDTVLRGHDLQAQKNRTKAV